MRYELLQRLKRKGEKNMRNEKMKLIGVIVSLVATIAIWTGFLVSSLPDIVGDTLAVIWIVGSIAGYILGGGIKVALGTAWKLAKFGWIIVPFPFDLMTGTLTFVIACVVFLLFPVVFVFSSFIKKEGAE